MDVLFYFFNCVQSVQSSQLCLLLRVLILKWVSVSGAWEQVSGPEAPLAATAADLPSATAAVKEGKRQHGGKRRVWPEAEKLNFLRAYLGIEAASLHWPLRKPLKLLCSSGISCSFSLTCPVIVDSLLLVSLKMKVVVQLLVLLTGTITLSANPPATACSSPCFQKFASTPGELFWTNTPCFEIWNHFTWLE